MEADAAYQAALLDYENGVTDEEPEYTGGEEPDPAAYGVWVPGVPVIVEGWLDAAGTAPWLESLILNGIVGGVGAVLGFVPQMLILFFMLAILEDIGYMARVAFIMDRIFRRFGLSGKSFIPMLIGSGCSVPGIMASRTIENERDRRMTIMTTSFIPCGAKMPIVGLIAGALFGGAWWVAPSAYFIGVASIIISGVILKKTKAFAGEPAPFVMELPAYHVPSAGNVLRSTWERGWSFIKRAGTIILLASVFIWFTSGFGWVDGVFGMVEDMDHSMLARVGSAVAPIFAPLGFGTWQSTVATVMGLVAKEEVVGVFGVLYGVHGDAMAMVESAMYSGLAPIAAHFTQLSAFSFLLFNLLCAPCFAAIGAIRREMNSAKWTWIAIGYLTVYAYVVAFTVYQIGLMFTQGFTFATLIALALLAAGIYLLVRGNPYDKNPRTLKGVTA
jgi:ferrous iron transport protein B